MPRIQSFRPQDYGGGIQNWGMVQDPRRVLYFANNNGVLEYDGVEWRLIPMPNRSPVLAIGVDDTGRIYAGAIDEIGYLSPNEAGELESVSLVTKINPADRRFGRVRGVRITPDAVYFRTDERLFRSSKPGGDLDVFRTSTSFGPSFVHRDRLYVHQTESGLKTFEGDVLRTVPGGEVLATVSVVVLLPLPNGRILVGTADEGLLLYDLPNGSLERFKTEADAFLQEHRLTHAAAFQDGSLALTTATGGVAIVENDGRLRQVLDKASGLRSQIVYFASVDDQRGLWLGLDNGLARVDTPSPVSSFSTRSALESTVYAVARHQNRLYVGTPTGAYYLATSPTPGASSHFEQVVGLPGPVNGLLSVDGALLAAVEVNHGVYRIEGQRAFRLHPGSARTLYPSERHPDRIYLGLTDGLARLELEGGEWRFSGRVPGVFEEIRSVAEDDEGALWLGTRNEGALRVADTGTGATAGEIQVARFGVEDGLPAGWVRVFRHGGRVLFGSSTGLLRFDEDSARFVNDSTHDTVMSDGNVPVVGANWTDSYGRTWISLRVGERRQIGVLDPRENGISSWRVLSIPALEDFGLPMAFYADAKLGTGSVLWVGGLGGLMRYDTSMERKDAAELPTRIRRVTVVNGPVVFGGVESQAEGVELPYTNNALRFEYAAMNFRDPASTEFQFWLQPFESGWSGWTREAAKDYTNLPEGDYRFRVRARSGDGRQGSEGSYAFTLAPPWYRTWWAYTGYVVLALASVLGLVQVRVRHLERKTRALETVIAQRTAEIESQRDKLRQMDQNKSRFFANISHEFRTPLTLILGPLEKLRAERPTANVVDVIERNATHLLRLVNQLLDLSRLEAGKMPLRASPRDVVTWLKGVTMSFASAAERAQVTLSFDAEPEAIVVYFDASALEKVFYNLLSNALKFTQEGGSVSVAVTATPSSVRMTVMDTGAGIPAEQVSQIFERFYQVDDSSTREHEGTGIGLALVKELIERHHGEILVESEQGQGTVFTITLPLGKGHLKEEEIIQPTDDETRAGPPKPSSDQPSAHEEPATARDDDTVVLIVDDHADVRAYVREKLTPMYTVLEAENGDEAIAKAIEATPDLVVSDVMMPKKDGYEVCRALKTNEKTSHIPVILLTARAGAAEKIEGLEGGADDYLVKPFDSEELSVRIKNLIETRRRLRERFRREVSLRPSEIAVTDMDQAFLQRVLEAVEERMADAGLTVDEVGRALGMSRSQLHRKLKALTDQSCGQIIQSVRLHRASDLLKQRAGTVADIAYRVGFEDPSYFARAFRKQFGNSPSEALADSSTP